MGFYRKIQTEGWGYTFLKTSRNFKFFHCLYPYRNPVEKAAVYPWKLRNSAKLCDTLWKFQEIKNQDPWKFHMSFLVLEHPRKFPIFLIWPLDFPATCSFSSITIGGWGRVIWLVHFHFLLNSPKLKGLAARAYGLQWPCEMTAADPSVFFCYWMSERKDIFTAGKWIFFFIKLNCLKK